ncbi:MAG: glycosyltransferase family 4 protein [Deltaproteobacteria bacterium]|nr:glycosyltransferase family 4 protein [Deltaproteobacteria bacterium]
MVKGQMKSHIRKIAVVIPKYGLVGGAEQFAAMLTECIAADRRYEMHVFANRLQAESPLIKFHKVPIISFPKFLTTISFAWFVRREIERTGVDLIHTHDRIFDADIFTMHGIPHRIWVRKIRKKSMSLYDYATAWVEGCLVQNKRCNRFLSVSHLAKDKFIEAYDFAKDKVEVIHPGVDVKRFENINRELSRKDIEGNYGIAADETLILFVSMNFEIKGLDTLIAALGAVKKKDPPAKFKLLIIGKGDKKKYRQIAENLGVSDHVIFTGVVEKNTLAKIYRAGDIYAMLSKFDTFGLAVLEAMAASLPVIVSDHVGAKDIVEHGKNGFIARGENAVDQVADYLQLALNKDARIEMSKYANLTAQNHTWEAAAEKVRHIYENRMENKLLY